MNEVVQKLLLAIVVVPFLLAGCGGGSGGSAPSSNDAENVDIGVGYANINQPSNLIEYCENVTLSGRAFVSPTMSGCCSGTTKDLGVAVSVRNKTTGANRFASQYFSVCSELILFSYYYYPCNHTWEASVPLEIGDNVIVVEANDGDGNIGYDSIIVYRPEDSYVLSGNIFNLAIELNMTNDAPIKLHLTGDNEIDQYQQIISSIKGFQFPCVPNGTYKVTPISTINYIFEPESQIVTIDGKNISNINFVTEAYYIYVSFDSDNPNRHPKEKVEILNEDGDVIASSMQEVYALGFPVPLGATYTIHYEPESASDYRWTYSPQYTSDLLVYVKANGDVVVTMPDDNSSLPDHFHFSVTFWEQ